MLKSSRWICRDCAHICVSRADLADTWCTCGHYQLANQIEIPRARTLIECDWSKATVQLTGEAMIELSNKIEAERAAWRKALGVSQGFDIPDDPLPATAEEAKAEIAIVRKLESEALQLRYRLPPGPEYESAGVALVYWRSRRINLECAIRDRKVR